ncbi:MAG: hypothetical protein KC422_14885 [Trueperaceae bacterium]|nr:hypothetical protein [Trueperaceae bacterium]
MSKSDLRKQETPLMTYQIRLKGQLKNDWAEWFEGQSITHEISGTTLLICQVPDQPALFGLLRRVRDLGMHLISVKQIQDSKDQPC